MPHLTKGFRHKPQRDQGAAIDDPGRTSRSAFILLPVPRHHHDSHSYNPLVDIITSLRGTLSRIHYFSGSTQTPGIPGFICRPGANCFDNLNFSRISVEKGRSKQLTWNSYRLLLPLPSGSLHPQMFLDSRNRCYLSSY